MDKFLLRFLKPLFYVMAAMAVLMATTGWIGPMMLSAASTELVFAGVFLVPFLLFIVALLLARAGFQVYTILSDSSK